MTANISANIGARNKLLWRTDGLPCNGKVADTKVRVWFALNLSS